MLADLNIPYDERMFLRLHRSGRYRRGRVRPIIAKFHHYLDTERVWNKRRETKDSVYLRMCYSEVVRRRRRRILQKIVDTAQSIPSYNKKCYLSNDKLMVNDRRYTISSLQYLPQDLQIPVATETIRNGEKTLFEENTCPLSNSYTRDFKVDGEYFNTVNQYYHYQKSMIHNDLTSAVKILTESNPERLRQFVKQGKDDDESNWDVSQEAHDIMKKALRAKFSDPYLKSVLTKTGNTILATLKMHTGVLVSTHSTVMMTTSNMNQENGLAKTIRDELK